MESESENFELKPGIRVSWGLHLERRQLLCSLSDTAPPQCHWLPHDWCIYFKQNSFWYTFPLITMQSFNSLGIKKLFGSLPWHKGSDVPHTSELILREILFSLQFQFFIFWFFFLSTLCFHTTTSPSMQSFTWSEIWESSLRCRRDLVSNLSWMNRSKSPHLREHASSSGKWLWHRWESFVRINYANVCEPLGTWARPHSW